MQAQDEAGGRRVALPLIGCALVVAVLFSVSPSRDSSPDQRT
jgi:hypothetical protein